MIVQKIFILKKQKIEQFIFLTNIDYQAQW